MSALPQDFVGKAVYARDDVMIGHLKELVFGGEYALVRRSFFSRILVPVEAIEERDGRPTIMLTSSYLDNAPKVDAQRELSPAEKARLEQFYLKRAA